MMPSTSIGEAIEGSVGGVACQGYQLLLQLREGLEEIGDEATARAIVLMGDGLYYNAMFQDAPPRDVDGLLRIVEVLRASVSRG